MIEFKGQRAAQEAIVSLAERGDAGAMHAVMTYNAALTLGTPIVERVCWLLDETIAWMKQAMKGP